MFGSLKPTEKDSFFWPLRRRKTCKDAALVTLSIEKSTHVLPFPSLRFCLESFTWPNVFSDWDRDGHYTSTQKEPPPPTHTPLLSLSISVPGVGKETAQGITVGFRSLNTGYTQRCLSAGVYLQKTGVGCGGAVIRQPLVRRCFRFLAHCNRGRDLYSYFVQWVQRRILGFKAAQWPWTQLESQWCEHNGYGTFMIPSEHNLNTSPLVFCLFILLSPSPPHHRCI